MALDNLLRRALTTALVIPIRLYRLFLSPLVGPACRFSPSCSEYALDALHQHGPIKGTVLAARRLSRCHPISWLGGSSGFDPVPPVR
ncbi:MAG TPA: membrane protein insertion efficiency factor YidD [Rhizomicrobium sp.]|nr:membrane protein insertion efficiency factor YidD [Rhizomicrobium sp.]